MAKYTANQRLETLYDLARRERDRQIKASRIRIAEHYYKVSLELEFGRSVQMPGVSSDTRMARIEPWDGDINPKELLIEADDVGDIEQHQILTSLERRGICQLRITAQSADEHVIKTVAKLIGPLTRRQNDFKKDTVKLIVPKAAGAAFSGDTLADLGLHVDGTQHPETPSILLFHYVSAAKLGAMSVFVDTAKALLDIKAPKRNQIFVNLARSDAATFSKKKMVHIGPLFYFSPTGRLVCRIRFDEVIAVHPDCVDDFNYLKRKFNDPKYRLEFKPREGDMIIFDNWRVLHARDEVFGKKVRQHWRGWVSNLKPALQPDYYLGVRPFSAALATQIQDANRK